MGKVLILGLGNILLRDEGLGVRAVELLGQRYQLPPEVEVCDGGCMGLELLPREHLLIEIDYLADTERRFRLKASGQRYREMVNELKGQGVNATGH